MDAMTSSSGLGSPSWNKRYLDIMGATVEPFTKYSVQLLDLYVESAKRGLFGPGDPVELAQERIYAVRSGPLIHTEDLTPSPGRVVRINRFRLDNGGICATFRGETEERRIEAQLRQAQKMEAVGKLTGGVAHDLNNILAVVIGNAEILLDSVGEDIDREALDDVLSAANRGAELTHRLLAFARKQPLTPQPTRVASVSRPELPVVFMSGYTEDMIPQAQLEAGVTLLPKPFQLAVLARVLRQKLRRA